MKTKPLTDEAGEVRELTTGDMDRMVPFAEMHPELAKLLPQPRDGRAGSSEPEARQSVHLRLDPAIVAHFKATGPGWQARINDALKDAIRRGR